MWFKKKSVLQADHHYNSNTAVDGIDWRVINRGQTWPISQTLPSAADANKYFYLPALGFYYSGRLYKVGDDCHYWSSSAGPWNNSTAYSLYFNSGSAGFSYGTRDYGYRVDWPD